MRSRLLRGLGRGGQANDGGAVRQRDQMLPADDVLDFGQRLLVVRQDLIRGELVLLERADDVAIIGRGKMPLLRDLGRQLLHVALHLSEALMRQLSKLLR